MANIDVADISRKHTAWLAGEAGGKRADLSKANLTLANLIKATMPNGSIHAW